jgi:hypothetical protein
MLLLGSILMAPAELPPIDAADWAAVIVGVASAFA